MLLHCATTCGNEHQRKGMAFHASSAIGQCHASHIRRGLPACLHSPLGRRILRAVGLLLGACSKLIRPGRLACTPRQKGRDSHRRSLDSGAGPSVPSWSRTLPLERAGLLHEPWASYRLRNDRADHVQQIGTVPVADPLSSMCPPKAHKNSRPPGYLTAIPLALGVCRVPARPTPRDPYGGSQTSPRRSA